MGVLITMKLIITLKYLEANGPGKQYFDSFRSQENYSLEKDK
jgi:hypothetical protein